MRGIGRARLVIGLLAVTAVVAIAAYLSAAVIAYDRISRVEAHCGGRFLGYTPAAWSTNRPTGHPEAAGFDPAPYLVAEYDEVRFPSRDAAIDLHAWWLPSPNGPGAPAVIIIPGRGSCIRDPDSLLPAGMLHRLGYGVLLLDLRDHGESTVEDGRYAGGTEEYRDVQAAVDWLVAQGAEPGHIGVLGTSMGAATAIIATGQDDRIAAAWEDSSYADMERRIAEELEQRGYPRLLAPAAVLVARLVSGDDLASHTVIGEVGNLRGRHLFISHGAEDQATYLSAANELDEAARSAGVLTDLWIVPEAGHTDAMFLDPAEYEERLGGFFGPALGS
jgi:dipeptidyl aminopeptidase/acylaminoacyl peptidase